MAVDPRSLLVGVAAGTVWPPRPPPVLPDKDARDLALERLALYMSCLTFRRTMEKNAPPQKFRIPRERVHVYQPDDVHRLEFPAIGIVHGQGFHEYYGLGPPEFVPGSEGKAGPGTGLLRLSDYVERVTIEVMAHKHSFRRAIVAGLTAALRGSMTSSRIQLHVPGYYGIPASFSLEETMYLDEPDNVRNRRRAHLFVEMRINEVQPVTAVPMQPPIVDFGGGPNDDNIFDGNYYLDLNGTVFGVRRPCPDEDS